MTEQSQAELQHDTALSTEKVFERLASTRDQATKESNRFFVVSIFLVGLYLIRASDLRIDLTLFNANVLKVPYGVFFFLLASQLSQCMSLLRLADSIAYKRAMQEAAANYGAADVNEFVKRYPNQFDWFSVTAEMVDKAAGRKASKFFFYFSAILTALFALGLLLSPIACGVYFLVDNKRQIVAGNHGLQYWTVVGSTIFAALWFANYIAVYRLSSYTPAAE